MYTCTHLPVYFKVKITNFKECKDDHRFRKIYFSLEWPTIFLPTPFSYNYPSCSFLCMSNSNPLLHY